MLLIFIIILPCTLVIIIIYYLPYNTHQSYYLPYNTHQSYYLPYNTHQSYYLPYNTHYHHITIIIILSYSHSTTSQLTNSHYVSFIINRLTFLMLPSSAPREDSTFLFSIR